MKPSLNRSRQTIISLLMLSLTGSYGAFANEVPEPPSSNVPLIKPSLIIKRKILEEKTQKTVKDAADTVVETHKALIALENNDAKRAQSLLQDVSGKLDIILAKYPNVELVSANIDTDIIEFEGDAKAAQKAIDAADDLLDDGKLQEARQIIIPLQSEMRVTTTSLPLKSFPQAIKEAAIYLSKGKTNEAASTIYEVLNTLVETTEIMPLPVLHAEVLLSDAAEVEHKKDLSQEQSRTTVLKLTDAAKDQLKLAQVLGYGDKNDYSLLYTAIDEIEDTIHSEKSAANWAAIKQQFATLKSKLTYFKK